MKTTMTMTAILAAALLGEGCAATTARLHPAQVAAVREAGQSREDVMALVGAPSDTRPVRGGGGETWYWDYARPGLSEVFSVRFDASGRVVGRRFSQHVSRTPRLLSSR